jgi:hypothetical protein
MPPVNFNALLQKFAMQEINGKAAFLNEFAVLGMKRWHN